MNNAVHLAHKTRYISDHSVIVNHSFVMLFLKSSIIFWFAESTNMEFYILILFFYSPCCI